MINLNLAGTHSSQCCSFARAAVVRPAASIEVGSLPIFGGGPAGDCSGEANGRRRSPRPSDIDGFSDAQRLLELDAQVPDRAVNPLVAEQELDPT